MRKINEYISDYFENIVYDKTQNEDCFFSLTINNIYSFESKGELDFGGSEYIKSKFKKINPEKKDEDDKYGWWFLDEGIYKARLNEKVKKINESITLIIEPHKRLLDCGVTHNTEIITNKGKIEVFLQVGENGVNIKENARISTVKVFK
ncbi:MAG TPA: hypothetical protein VKN74_06850 [Candidatus Mcinerneyibacterium sp.]|nr:hypothetical protein [Candidatus Mcinerneyibacterium sp.]